MNLKGEITEKAMMQGVKDSEAMILFLTNSYLSRPFCLKELEWAINFKKPILIIVEKEDRFWPFDIERWRNNQCSRDSSNNWVKGWLSRKYEDCSDTVKTFIEYQHKHNMMLEYRRRGFEIDALAREVVRRVRITGRVPWGGIVPLDRELIEVAKYADPHVYILHDPTSEVVSRMAKQAYASLRQMMPKCKCVQKIECATDVVILLTKQVLKHGSKSLKEVLYATTELRKSMITFVYLNEGEDAWDWSLPSKVAFQDEKQKTAFQTSICGREAYIWRSENQMYEHKALIRDIILKRIFTSEEEDEDEVETKEESSIGSSSSSIEEEEEEKEEVTTSKIKVISGKVQPILTKKENVKKEKVFTVD